MFKDLLDEYTHWGWSAQLSRNSIFLIQLRCNNRIDIDVLVGDLSPLVKKARFYDVVTYPDPVGESRFYLFGVAFVI